MRKLVLCLLAPLVVMGCVAQVQQAQQRPPRAPSPLLKAAEPIALERVVINIKPGTRVGGYVFNVICTPGPLNISWSNDKVRVSADQYRNRFYETMTSAGIRTVGDPSRMFDQAAERASARFLLGAQVTDLEYSLCEVGDLLGGGTQGEAFVRLSWQVYSIAERRVVYEIKSEGNGKIERQPRNAAMLDLLLLEGFAAATESLAADPKFQDLIAGAAAAPSASLASATPSLDLPRYANFRNASTARLSDVQGSTVTVLTGSGHGSGFFVSEDGLILTNRHVVGDAKTVNVRLPGGFEVPAQVLRGHESRDVALIKVELARTRPLPLRLEQARVGEEVYAIGTPIDPKLSSSVTRGIVSALRRETRGGVDLDFIQSDAALQGGNSGGPLLDSAGNVIGIAVSGIGRDQLNAGINFFIPIGDALERLNIKLGTPRDLPS